MLAFAAVTALACAGGDWDASEGSMFTPHVINQPQSAAFFRTLETPFYDGYDDDRSIAFNEQNAEEWRGFFDQKVSKESMDYWLYHAPIKQIDSMIFALKGKPANLTAASKTHSLGQLPSGRATAFLYYTGFARRNEAFAAPQSPDPWDPKPLPPADVSVSKQIAGGLNFFTKASEPFLKGRYAFQLERLYFYSGDYDKTISFYNEQESSMTAGGTSIRWRALGYKAAALYRQKKYAESNNLYAQIFDQYAPLRKSAYLSFHPLKGGEWQQCLNLAGSTRQKEVLWQLMGLYANDLQSMKEILKLNPQSELADLLLVRAVNTEEWQMDVESDEKTGKRYHVDKDLLKFLDETAAQLPPANSCTWNLAAAYLNYMEGNYAIADQQLARARKAGNPGASSLAQYHLLAVYGNLKKAGSISESLENTLLPDLEVLFSKQTGDLENFRSGKARRWTRYTLANLYLNKGDVETAELIYPGIRPDHFSSVDAIRRMIAYYDKAKPSALEKFFFGQAELHQQDYQELLGIRYAQQDKLDEALLALKAAGNDGKLPGNPFTIHIRDCHDCDHAAVQKTKYTKVSFIEKMIAMKAIAAAKPAEAAQNYFLVANGFYNMTYFGNARLFYDNRVDNSIYAYEHDLLPEESSDLALKYYLLALQHSTDAEFRAKCTFMAAKCEQNTFFTHMPENYKGDFKAGIYFASLKKEYSQTRYYQDVIRECGYFKTYLNTRR